MKLKLYSLLCCYILSINGLLAADTEISNESFLEIGVGSFAISTPHYAGSDQSELHILPFPYIDYESENFSLNREGLKGHVSETGRWNFDLSFAGTFPVDSNDNRARQGMPDLDWVGLGGPALTYRISQTKTNKLRLILPIRFALSTDFAAVDYRGWEIAPSLRWESDFEKKTSTWQVISAASMFYASEKYNDYTYGVAPEYTTNARAAYQSEQGYAGFEFILGTTCRQERFWVGAFIRYRSIQGAIFEDSPLVRKKENYYAGISFAWMVYSSTDE